MGIVENKQDLCNFMRELYSQKFFTDIGGNISIKDPGNNSFWITPTRIRKNTVTPDQLIEISIETGEIKKNLNGLDPSVEFPMHLKIYKEITKVNSIIHTHAPYATAYSLLEQPEPVPHLTAELKILVPKIIVTPFASSGSKKIGEVVSKGLNQCDTIILKNHGTVSVSINKETLIDAIIKTRGLEEMLKLFTITKQMRGNITPFPD